MSVETLGELAYRIRDEMVILCGGHSLEVESVDLWDWLHDAVLERCDSDLTARSLTLILEVAHIAEHRGLGESSRFVLTFRGVRSVRASRSVWALKRRAVQVRKFTTRSSTTSRTRIRPRWVTPAPPTTLVDSKPG